MRYLPRILLALVFSSLIFSSCFARTVQFSGRTWDVRQAGLQGPGPNRWSDSNGQVFMDAQGRLHQKIRKIGPAWYSSQITLQQSLGYGTYEFRLDSNTELFDQETVVGLFTYANDFEEIDIELSTFGGNFNTNGHFTVQPYWVAGNQSNYDLNLTSNLSTHKFTWSPTGIEFMSLHGHQSQPSQPSDIISQFSYTGSANPPSLGNERATINFWLNQGNVPTNGLEHELIVSSFTYTPLHETADFDIDLDVDAADLAIWEASYGVDNGGDTDIDSDTDGTDFLAWQQQFTGPGPLAGSLAIPEPSSLVLLSIGMFALGIRK